jgi:hypothetical protein
MPSAKVGFMKYKSAGLLRDQRFEIGGIDNLPVEIRPGRKMGVSSGLEVHVAESPRVATDRRTAAGHSEGSHAGCLPAKKTRTGGLWKRPPPWEFTTSVNSHGS